MLVILEVSEVVMLPRQPGYQVAGSFKWLSPLHGRAQQWRLHGRAAYALSVDARPSSGGGVEVVVAIPWHFDGVGLCRQENVRKKKALNNKILCIITPKETRRSSKHPPPKTACPDRSEYCISKACRNAACCASTTTTILITWVESIHQIPFESYKHQISNANLSTLKSINRSATLNPRIWG